MTLSIIAEALDLPYTQVNVAMELLKERCILETDGRVLDVTAWSDRRTARFCLDPEAQAPC